MYGNLAAAGLVEHGDLDAIAETAFAFGEDAADIVDEHAVFDIVVGYVSADGAYAAIIPHAHVVQGGIPDAAVALEAACEGE